MGQGTVTLAPAMWQLASHVWARYRLSRGLSQARVPNQVTNCYYSTSLTGQNTFKIPLPLTPRAVSDQNGNFCIVRYEPDPW